MPVLVNVQSRLNLYSFSKSTEPQKVFMLSSTIRAIALLLILTIVLQGCSKKEEKSPKADISELPMKAIDLGDLEAFKTPDANWKIAGAVFADYKKDHSLEASEGKGVLVNLPDESKRGHLFTNFDHGDMELELDFLLPKGTNSGLYFQGRYEVQLFDSWNKKDPQFSDCGGIYERWDDAKPDGQHGYEGHAPKVNACKAPGLWQHMKIFFRAPRFDARGNKTENARFENVYLNGYLVQENVEVTGPTRSAFFNDEKPTGPFMIQGDHGPVAFRNLKYKSYTLDSLLLENIRYDFYDNPSSLDRLPDFTKLTPARSGTVANLDVSEAADKNEYYSLVYNAELNVPVEGDYLFTAVVDEGAELFIDDESILKMDGVSGGGRVTGMVNLAPGKHSFRIHFYQNNWSARILLFYEGPGISRKLLAARVRPERRQWQNREPMIVEAAHAPEMIRSFIKYKDTVKTHVISIGDPKKVNYTFDLQQGALVKAWKGTFADVFGMWHSRGESQLLQPGNFTLDLTDGLPIARLTTPEDPWPLSVSPGFIFKKYTIDDTGHPVFQYTFDKVIVQNEFHPSQDTLALKVLVRLAADTPQQNLWYRIAASDKKIEQMPDGSYNIGGDYYLLMDNVDGVQIRKQNELVVPVLKENKTSTIQYSILW